MATLKRAWHAIVAWIRHTPDDDDYDVGHGPGCICEVCKDRRFWIRQG